MKKRYYLYITLIIAASTFMLSSCQQNSAKEPLPTTTSATNTAIPTASDAKTDSNYLEKLKAEGYSPEEMEAAQTYVSRVLLQLNEIETFGRIYTKPGAIESFDTDDTSRYSELLLKIDEEKAVYYLAKLNRIIKSMEDAFNEYLFSLQSDLDIETYFKDKEKYDKEKNEKLSTLSSDGFITTRDIENTALEKLQNMNNPSKKQDPTIPGIINPNQDLLPDSVNPQPNIPTVEVPKPIDPSKEINNRPGPQF